MSHIIPKEDGFYWFHDGQDRWEPVQCLYGTIVYSIACDCQMFQHEIIEGIHQFGPRIDRDAKDQLSHLFQLQHALNQRCGVNTDNLTEAEKTKWVLEYTRAMQQEIAELIDSVPWKFWAKYQKFDEQNAKVEVVDLFHFLISLAQVLGMSAEDVYQAYLKKNSVNNARQDSGYQVKDEGDSKHI